MKETPQGNRLHIVLLGKRNAGKSSLLNAITGQNTAVVSDTPGTTTDPVNKAMEVNGIGPCLFVDTAGMDDEGELGELRKEKTRQALLRAHIIIIVLTPDDVESAPRLAAHIPANGEANIVYVINKCDTEVQCSESLQKLRVCCGQEGVALSAKNGKGIGKLLERLRSIVRQKKDEPTLLGNLVTAGQSVLLVMPQDAQAPKGRLILPQVQTLRELLDRHCLIMACTPDELPTMLRTLKEPPHLIITDSQAFATVYPLKPEKSLLTSFSVLFAAHKGDAKTFFEGAKAIGKLGKHARVLIAEACTHAPMTEDIGREKIPALLRKRLGNDLNIDVYAGNDYPENLETYHLIIHCGACMFNRPHVLARIDRARNQGVPITNYGMALAFLTGILDKVTVPDL